MTSAPAYPEWESRVRSPLEHLDDWGRLHEELVARRGLYGVRAFSRQAFQRQLALPGLIALRAIRHGRIVP